MTTQGSEPRDSERRDGERRDGTHRRVVITGMGAVTPSGLDVENTWRAVVKGCSAISVLDGAEFADLPVRIGGQVRGFDPQSVLRRNLARRLSPVQHWAVAAADQAMRQAGVLIDGAPASAAALPWLADRFSIIAATGSGPIDAMQRATRDLDARGPRAVPFSLAVYGAPDAAAALLAERYQAFGSSQGVSATCASGAIALGQGLRSIRHGYADAVLVVGMEDCLNPVNLASNANMRALASGYEDNPTAACRPFDRGRAGFVMSSGAAAILLESEQAWRDRNRDRFSGPNRDTRGADAGSSAAAGACAAADTVAPLAELAGFGAASDAYHATAPHPAGRGAAQAVRDCLADAGVSLDRVDHINAHGTGTPLGDAAELAALHSVFGERAQQIPISATKSSTGHLLGASGIVEAVISVMTLRSGMLPPTMNLDDSEFPEWAIVASRASAMAVDTVLSNSFGFGGHNGAVLLKRWD